MGQDPEVCSYIFSLVDLSQQRKGFRSTQLVAPPGSQHECCLNISSHPYPYSVIFKDKSTAQGREETEGYHKARKNTEFQITCCYIFDQVSNDLPLLYHTLPCSDSHYQDQYFSWPGLMDRHEDGETPWGNACPLLFRHVSARYPLSPESPTLFDYPRVKETRLPFQVKLH